MDANPPRPWRPGFGAMLATSLFVYAVSLVLTWKWYDVDEFVNLQQALRLREGLALYTETPAHHPPMYVDAVRWLVHAPLPALLTARAANLLLAWSAGALVAHLWWQRGHHGRARIFLLLWSANGFVLLTGTRAMNEAPVLFLLAAAFYVLVRWNAWPVAGVLIGAAMLTRLTTVFFLPFLVMLPPRRAAATCAMAAATVTVVLAAYAAVHPGFLQGLLRQTVMFHADLDPRPLHRRLGPVLLGAPLPLVLLLRYLRPELIDVRQPLVRAGFAASAGAAAMMLLPDVHIHYFLPLAVVPLAVATELIHRPPSVRAARIGVVAAVLLLATAQGVAFARPGGTHDLDRHEAATDWIRNNTPVNRPVLASHPIYAVNGERTNLGGYFWALRNSTDGHALRERVATVSVVVVSHSHHPAGRAFPEPAASDVADLACRRFAAADVHWTGAVGPAPPGFDDDCTASPRPQVDGIDR